MWDPTLLYFKDQYYMLSMYLNPKSGKWDGMWAAVSEDGVHFNDIGCVLTGDANICKMFAFINDGHCIINHGSFSGRPDTDNDTLRFYQSDDMRNWTHLSDNHPDPQWYHAAGRWDHMYVIPKGDPGENQGYWGYVVATPNKDLHAAIGMMESSDGLHWNILPPPVMEWGDMPEVGMLEVGGCEKIGDRYYFIGGVGGYAGNCGYSLYTFVSDSPTGPFRPDTKAFRLCGFDRLPNRVFTQNLAAFCRGKNGELLVSNAFDAGFPEKIWLLPNRKAVVDSEGHLRLGYWEQNDLAKGPQLDPDLSAVTLVYMEDRSVGENGKVPELNPPQYRVDSKDDLFMATGTMTTGFHLDDLHALSVLDKPFDFTKGVILEGIMTTDKNPPDKDTEAWPMCWRPSSVGFYLEHDGGGSGTAITVEVGHAYHRRSLVEKVTKDGQKLQREVIDVTGEGCATVAGISGRVDHPFKLLIRQDMFELYLDGLLVQSFITMEKPSGRLGFLLQNAQCRFHDMKLFEMNL